MAEEKKAIGFNSKISTGPRETGINIINSEGKIIDNVPYGTAGLIGGEENVYRYTDSEGKTRYTQDAADLPASITLNEETGDIEITAPKSVYESELFKQTFDEDTLKEYSQAYKLNPEYKVSVREKNEDTGEEEEKEVTIPEYIQRLNSSIDKYMENLRSLHSYKKELQSKYGNKVDNMSDEVLAIAIRNGGSAIYLPDSIFSLGTIGNKKNPFLALKDKRTEDGLVSLEEFEKVYTRDNIGRDEMASLLAAIEGSLKGSEWSAEETYVDEDGVEHKNPNSASEAAKLLAFRNYLYTNNPDSTWNQQAGDYIESFFTNGAYWTTKIFGNLADLGQTVVTLGNGTEVHEAIESMDEAMEYFNSNNALVWDAVVNAQIWGMIGGTILGTKAVSQLGTAAAEGVKNLPITLRTKLLEEAAAATGTTAAELASGSAGVALTAETLAQIAANSTEISLGARAIVASLPVLEKVALLTNVATTAVSGVAGKNIFTEYVFDTIHDAILYDFGGLRNTILKLSKEADTNEVAASALNYWMGQYADNAKWWVPMGIGRTAIKYAGKTALGQATNIVLTKYINKFEAMAGEKIQGWQDNMAGGSVVKKLQDQLDKLGENEINKRNRIQNKIDIENQNALLREARKSLGDIKLDWDGLKLTEESLENWQNAISSIRARELAIDLYRHGVEAETRRMHQAMTDPATGKPVYLYAELAGANVKASNWYFGLVDLGNKYGLTVAERSLLNQDVIDYWVGSYKYRVYDYIAKTGSRNAADAQSAAEIVSQNLQKVETRLPKEITEYIDTGIQTQVFQQYYKQLNEYGVANKLLDGNTISSYEANPIWATNGYMPIVIAKDVTGRWVADDDKIATIIEQELEHYKYKANIDEHYADPEMVRQTRIRHMAQAKNNTEIWKAYAGFGSNATNVQIISGEETAYAKNTNEGVKQLQNAVEDNTKVFSDTKMSSIAKTKRRKPIKKVAVETNTKNAIVTSMPEADIRQYIASRKNGPLKNASARLTDTVDTENYAAWFESQSKSVQKYLRQQYGITDGIGSYAALQDVMKIGGDDFQSGLERAWLMGDKAFGKSSLLNEAARNLEDGKDAFYQGVLAAKIKGELRNVLTLDVDSFVDEVLDEARKLTDDYVDGVMKTPGVKDALAALANSSDASEDAYKYIALRELKKGANLDSATETYLNSIEKIIEKAGLKGDEERTIKKKVIELLTGTIDEEADSARLAARTTSPDILSSEDLIKEVKELNDRITEADKRIGQDYVMYLDSEGRSAYAEVDPAFASLFNYRYKMEKGEASVLARINAKMSKAFRYGTTSVNLSSFGNQMFRDFGNAIFVGGSWQTIKSNYRNLVDVFGENIVEQIKRFDPEGYEMKQVQSLADQTGKTIEEAAVSRELMRGQAMAPSTTERTLYKTFMKQAYGGDSLTVLEQAKTKLQNLADKLNPDDLLNGKRENYLRNRVFASSLNDALNQGYTLEQARVYADFAMNNATTNFARQVYHMQAIADSTPYFRAAINGSKSFWRMWALDPVGISGRVMGGLILPTMYLTGASLGTEENREVYMNIPEYQKQNSLVFVVRGQAMSIPIPQELGSIVAPFRQFVEYLYDSNKNDFWELMGNDLLGFSPIDLQGFSTIDMDKMISDPTIFDRLSRGSARVFSQMAPIPVKSAYMLMTGTDPYSGKSLRDSSYMYWNDETDSLEVMDYNQNAFAKWFASLWGDEMSPELAEKLVSGVLGSTGSNLLGDLAKLVQENPGAALQNAGKNLVGQISNPFTVNQYDLTSAIWKRAVRQLTTEKEAITSSKEWVTLNNELAQTKDPEKRKKLLSQRQDLVNEFQQKVMGMITRLSTEYEGTLDRQKLAAAITLLNFNSDSAYQSGSQYSSNLSTSLFYDSKNAAVHTLERMGVTGTSDMSIFGYLAVGSDGTPVVKYSSPVAIMDMQNQWRSQDDIHAANIKALISQNSLYEAHKSVSDQIQKIYGKKNLTKQDYANIEAIQINWNAQLAKTIAPYVSKMTPEAAINNTEVMNALYPYVEVPGSWETNNKGKYVSLGSRGNKKKAYYESWIKSLFNVNDAYKGQY